MTERNVIVSQAFTGGPWSSELFVGHINSL